MAATAGVWVAVAPGKPAIRISVAGHTAAVGEGTTLGTAVRRFGLEARAGDLLDVEGHVLRSGVFLGRLLVNGRPASAGRRLRAGDRIGVRDTQDRHERLIQEVVQASLGRPANPQFFVDRIPGRSVISRGAVSHKLASALFVPEGPAAADSAVALTFDDGPSRYTSRFLALLGRFHVPATFFVVGTQAELFPDLVKRELSAGMIVADHSYDHPWRSPFAELPRPQIRREIDRGQKTLERLGVRSVLFRPPGGTVSRFVLHTASARGMRVVLWSVDARDWVAGTTADQIVRRVLGTVQAGSIVVMHDGGGDREATLEALPTIINGIRARGLRLVALAPTG